MELYGINQRSEIDHHNTHSSSTQSQWPDQNALQDAMWRLDISGQKVYPERPGVSNCVYYMRTGSCGFGGRCRYNHPQGRAAAVVATGPVGWDYPERPGEPLCQFYLKTGNCKFGAACKFHHPRDAGGSLSNAPLNVHGLPLRPGEIECSYYLKTGQCKFGRTCKFHHPQHGGISMPTPAPSFYPTVQTSPVPILPEQAPTLSPGYSVTRPPLVPGSYVPGSYGPVLLSPGVTPMPSWGSYSGPVSPVLSPGAQPAATRLSSYGVTSVPPTPGFTGSYPGLPSSGAQFSSSVKEYHFPERPGEPECQYFLKTGSCKFGASCRYHHPPDKSPVAAGCYLGPLGLPLRPGTQPCTFYMQNGYCKFGTTCKFDHPVGVMKYSPSASSLTETPVAPYMGGSTSLELLPGYAVRSQSPNPPVTSHWSSQSQGHGQELLSSSRSMGGFEDVSHSS